MEDLLILFLIDIIEDWKQKNLLFKKWKERYELAIIASNDGLWDMDLKSRKFSFSNKW